MGLAVVGASATSVRVAVAQGRKVLVLTEGTEHPDAIIVDLDILQPAPFVLHGRMSRKQRSALVADLDALPPARILQYPPRPSPCSCRDTRSRKRSRSRWLLMFMS